MIYRYNCLRCGTQDISKPISECSKTEHCPFCDEVMRKDYSGIAVQGTRDNFGVGMAFTDDESGKTIDNWKSWEKAGFRKPLEVTNDHVVKEKVKEKISKINKNK